MYSLWQILGMSFQMLKVKASTITKSKGGNKVAGNKVAGNKVAGTNVDRGEETNVDKNITNRGD